MFEALGRYAAAVDELLAADLDGLSRDELLEVVRSVETQGRRLACVDHALVAQLESRGVAHELAARTTSCLLQDMLRLSASEAGRRVHAARRMGPRRAMTGEELPPLRAEVAKGQAAGMVSVEQARVITQVLDKVPSATPVSVVDEVEETLVGHAAEHAPKDLRSWLCTPCGVWTRTDHHRRRKISSGSVGPRLRNDPTARTSCEVG